MTLHGLAADDTMHLDLDGAGLDPGTVELLQLEEGSLSATVGARVVLAPAEPGRPSWVVRSRAEQDAGHGPALTWDSQERRLTSFADTTPEVLETTGLVRLLRRGPATTAREHIPSSVEDAAETLLTEIGANFAYFDLLGLDWPVMRTRAECDMPRTWSELRQWALPLMASLRDQHSLVIDRKTRRWHPPYSGVMTARGVQLTDVPGESTAYRVGVREGWIVDVGDPGYWLRIAGATPRQHHRVAARRALLVQGEQREFTATPPVGGQAVSWVEAPSAPPSRDLVTVHHAPSGALLVQPSHLPREVDDTFEDICTGAGPADHLVLDLRGCPGGSVVATHRLRRRFLRARTLLGSVAYTDGQGELAPRRDRWAEPSERHCWPGRLTILIDSGTFSAAEELVWGLQGLDHVRVLGDTSGGGIGRPATFDLGDDLTVKISRSINYDRQGDPIDIHGIRPDAPLNDHPDSL